MEIERDPYKAAQERERAKHMTTYDETDPTWMYRRGPTGEIESKVFPAAKIPNGWYDSPAAIPADDGVATEEMSVATPADTPKPAKRRPGRPKGSGRKMSNGNG